MITKMKNRIVNLSPGPSPLSKHLWNDYLERIAIGSSHYDLVTQSHHSKRSREFISELKNKVAHSLGLSDSQQVCFLASSARESFCRIDGFMNMLSYQMTHHITGYWSRWACSNSQFKSNSYDKTCLHACLNETVDGVYSEPPSHSHLVVDATSMLFTKEVKKAAIIYASGQKIFSSPGFSIVIIDQELISQKETGRYSDQLGNYITNDSCNVTPPMHAMVLLDTFIDWLEFRGGSDWLKQRTNHRAANIYDRLSASDALLVEPSVRSMTAITFDVGQRHDKWLAYFKGRKISGILGHKQKGGFRISNFPGLSEEDYEYLLDCLENVND